MKKIYSIIIAAISIICFAACTDNDFNYVPQQDAIKVISQDLEFKAQASSGSIKVMADGAVTAISNKDWCHVSVSGNTINVSVDENTKYEGRSAIVTVRTLDKAKDVCVQQSGIVILFEYKTETVDSVSCKGGSYEFTARATDAIECSSDVDWITAVIENGVVKVTVAENKKSDTRSGKVTISAPEHDNKAVITIPQKGAEEQPSLVGTYSMTFYKSSTLSDANLKTIEVSIEQDPADESKYYIAGFFADDAAYAPLDFKLPFTYDEENQQLQMPNCTVIGNDGTYYIAPVYNYATATSANSTSYTQDATRLIIFDVKLENGKFTLTYHQNDKTHISNGFLFGRFDNNKTFDKNTRKSVQGYVRNAVLQQQ